MNTYGYNILLNLDTKNGKSGHKFKINKKMYTNKILNTQSGYNFRNYGYRNRNLDINAKTNLKFF